MPRMATGFVAWGPGLRSGLRVAGLRETDVAPTLARWLGVQLGVRRGTADGRLVRARRRAGDRRARRHAAGRK